MDEHTALVCTGGSYVAAACKGPDGCVASGGAVACDVRGNAEGEPCLDTGDKRGVCSVDKKSELTCVGGKTKVEACQGRGGCEPGASTVPSLCNKPLRAGEDCTGEGEDVCDDAGKSWLSCTHRKWVTTSACRGKSGCKFLASLGSIACDTSVGEPGDPCAGGATCTADRKSLLTCTDHKLAKSRDCPGPKGCSAGDGTEPSCDGEAKKKIGTER